MKRLLGACALVLGAGAGWAQTVGECDWRAGADALVEPWDENTALFSQGKVRIALLDRVEPAAAAFYVLILSPPYNELGERQCRILSRREGMGFAGLSFDTLEADYDPAVGLIFTMQAKEFDGLDYHPATLRFTVNQATGEIAGRIE
ncbi:hypothetical protein K1T73_07920 [Roseovarius sp. SCSIO 43702]|uniref:hypothetical protein n=1 Tax=Roseovarius sp. SCSIO 43702 TaxID=2823043 RepID=UPI001C73AA37|nr:hypothetical protein [Roseovarius sp. SCSIO 43702]QYX58275.1 hypothetical protein K1T73_07920 [Roseovarius sp. SCSIO 43702]